jgi:hypothetical protein
MQPHVKKWWPQGISGVDGYGKMTTVQQTLCQARKLALYLIKRFRGLNTMNVSITN